MLVQLNPELLSKLMHMTGRTKPCGKDHHVKFFSRYLSIVILVSDFQVFRCRDLLDGRGITANIPDAEFLGSFVVGIESLPESTNVNKKDSAIEVRLVFLGDNRLFGRIHTTDRRAVVSIHFP